MSLLDVSKSWSPRRYPSKQILIYAGDNVNQLHYISKGFIKIYSITDEGDERILLILKPQDMFPLLRDPEKTEHLSLYFYSSMTNVETYNANLAEIMDDLKDNPRETWELLRYISEFSNTLGKRLSQLESKKASEKLSNLFSYLIQICGTPTKLNAYVLSLKITQQEIANLVGLTRETVSKEMKKLENENKVAYHEGRLIVSAKYLEPQ